MPIRVLALFVAKPGQIEKLKSVLTGFIEPTRKEAGCVYYELQQNIQNPTDFSFIEEWESEELLNRHLESAHIVSARPLIEDLVASKPDIRRYKLIA